MCVEASPAEAGPGRPPHMQSRFVYSVPHTNSFSSSDGGKFRTPRLEEDIVVEPCASNAPTKAAPFGGRV